MRYVPDIMVNQQKKPQPQQCDHTLKRGPNVGCRCTTKTSFVNAMGLRLCSKHKAAAPPTTHVWAAITIQDTYRNRREKLAEGWAKRQASREALID